MIFTPRVWVSFKREIHCEYSLLNIHNKRKITIITLFAVNYLMKILLQVYVFNLKKNTPKNVKQPALHIAMNDLVIIFCRCICYYFGKSFIRAYVYIKHVLVNITPSKNASMKINYELFTCFLFKNITFYLQNNDFFLNK